MSASPAPRTKEEFDREFEACYQELRAHAQRMLNRERSGHVLQATALVHEVWIRLTKNGVVGFNDRVHFLRLYLRAMRRLLIEVSERKVLPTVDPASLCASLEEVHSGIVADYGTLSDYGLLDQALSELREQHADAADVAELKYLCGLTNREVAEACGKGVTWVKDRWEYARAWLARRVARLRGESPS